VFTTGQAKTMRSLRKSCTARAKGSVMVTEPRAIIFIWKTRKDTSSPSVSPTT